MTYFDALRAAARARESLLGVGLDPGPARIRGGVGGALDACRRIIDATADVACVYEPNAAFWEQYGPGGRAAPATEPPVPE